MQGLLSNDLDDSYSNVGSEVYCNHCSDCGVNENVSEYESQDGD